MEKSKPIIGLCGGVGAGKTTVAHEFAKLGCAVVNADELNHEVLNRRDVQEKLTGWWGEKILDEKGKIDRKSLGNIVFEDNAEMKRLTDVVHPLIAERQKELMAQYQRDPKVKAVVLDVPLLFEVGQDSWCDCVVFVEVSEKVRRERLEQTRGWTAERIKKVENLQFALDKKVEISEYRLNNDCSIPDLAEQVAKVFSRILES
jgi:dephospho-CoA kinase